jgi:predicted ATPase
VQQLGPRWEDLLKAHDAILRQAVAAHHGREVRTEGDSFFVAFAAATDAVSAAARAQRALYAHPWPAESVIRVRMGVHTGEASIVGKDYAGLEVHRAARIAATGHGGQVVLSDITRALVEHALPEGVSLVDMGEHRLKDLARPERIWQLRIDGLPSEFPALRSLDATPNNLPIQLTSFIGREREVAEARRRLGEARLLTLTGAGGTGKTRLGLQLAAEASDDFGDGVYWVALAPIEDPELVASAIAHALGVQEVAGRSPLEVVQQYLKSRKVLLVLDNFEQILPAAGTVADILRAAPEVKVIVTSRAPLKVSGERECPVPPLGLPDLAHLPSLAALSQFEAVRLFIERAMAVRPDFEVNNDNAPAVAGICALLDGLPLAIELAAARIRILSPQALLSRLENRLGDLGGGARDLPARQQTLRGAIAWSYDLLEPAVRRLMDRFSVFVRGGALTHVEAVCGLANERGAGVLDDLETLVEHNLLRTMEDPDEPRFLMLHVIREFSLERLEESADREDVRRRHAQVFLSLAETAAPQLTRPERKRWLDRMELEHDNVRAALSWFVSRNEAEDAMRMVASTWRFWHMRGHLREARSKIDQVLSLPNISAYPKERLRALEGAGGVAWWQGDMAASVRYYEDALGLAREIGTEQDMANALYNLAFPVGLALQRGARNDSEHAQTLLQEAQSHFEAAKDDLGVARSWWGMSIALTETKQYAEGFETAEKAAHAFDVLGRPFDMAWALHTVGFSAVRLGKLDRAREALDRGLSLLVHSGEVSGVPIFLADFADLAIASGDDRRAVRLRAASQAIQDRSGAGLVEENASGGYGEIKAGFSDEEMRALVEEGRAMELTDAVSYALSPDDVAARLPSIQW